MAKVIKQMKLLHIEYLSTANTIEAVDYRITDDNSWNALTAYIKDKLKCGAKITYLGFHENI